MKKALIALLVTLLAGVLGMVIGIEFLGGWPTFGSIVAVAVMGAFILYWNDTKK